MKEETDDEKATSDGGSSASDESAPRLEGDEEVIPLSKEKATSGGEATENNESAPELKGGEKVAQTDQNQTSQNGSNSIDMAAAGQDQVMEDPNGFGGFSLADLTCTGVLERPELYASFETSVFWLMKRLGMINNLL